MKLHRKYKFKIPRKLKKEIRKIEKIVRPCYRDMSLNAEKRYVSSWYEGYIVNGKSNRNTVRLIHKLKQEQIKTFNELVKSEIERFKRSSELVEKEMFFRKDSEVLTGVWPIKKGSS